MPSDKRKRDEAAPAPSAAPLEVLSPVSGCMCTGPASTLLWNANLLLAAVPHSLCWYKPVYSPPQLGSGQHRQSQYAHEQEGKQRGRDKKPRRGDADAEAQPAAPPSEFSSSLRAEVTSALSTPPPTVWLSWQRRLRNDFLPSFSPPLGPPTSARCGGNDAAKNHPGRCLWVRARMPLSRAAHALLSRSGWGPQGRQPAAAPASEARVSASTVAAGATKGSPTPGRQVDAAPKPGRPLEQLRPGGGFRLSSGRHVGTSTHLSSPDVAAVGIEMAAPHGRRSHSRTRASDAAQVAA